MMSDDKLIAHIARMWVDGGGDAEGVEWCWRKLRDAVAAEQAQRIEAQEYQRAQAEEEAGRELWRHLTKDMMRDGCPCCLTPVSAAAARRSAQAT